MKKILLLFILPLLSLSAYAQEIIYSEGFEEPEMRWFRIINMKNGGTVVLNIGNDEIEVRAYNSEHKKTGYTKTGHSAWTERKISAASFLKAFEVNGQVAVFVSQTYRGNVPVLHRLLIDPVSGKLAKADALFTLDEGMRWGGFAILKDPLSDVYCILHDIKESPDQSITMFDGSHNKTKELTLKVTGEHNPVACASYFYEKELYILIKDPNDKDRKEIVCPLSLAVLRADAKEFEVKGLGLKTIKDTRHADFKYNPKAGYLQYINTGVVKSESKTKFLSNTTQNTEYYATHLLIADPKDLSVLKSDQLDGKKMDEYAKAQLHKPAGYNGTFNELIVNNDNTSTLAYQEMYTISSSRGATSTQAGDLGLLYLDNKGEETRGYVILKAQVSGSSFMRNPEKISQYFDYSYFSTPDAEYVVYNDIPENFDLPAGKEPHSVSTVSDANSILYKLNNGKIEKSYLFGQPESKRDSKFSLTGSATYDKENRTYVTVMVDNKRGTKTAHLAWIKL